MLLFFKQNFSQSSVLKLLNFIYASLSMHLCIPIIGIHTIGEKKTENDMLSSEFSGRYYF